MKFRTFVAAKGPVQEADLLGVPSDGGSGPPAEGSSQPDLSQSGPSKTDKPEGDPSATGSGRPPGQSDEQMRLALALAVHLSKALAGLPHPWNKQFHAFKQPLQALVARLQEFT
jgi:hypothetical protein